MNITITSLKVQRDPAMTAAVMELIRLSVKAGHDVKVSQTGAVGESYAPTMNCEIRD